MPKILISTTIDSELHSQLKKLSYKLTARENVKINMNDLIEESLRRLIKEYETILNNENEGDKKE